MSSDLCARLYMAVSSMLVFLSCSVKEDRSACPFFLDVDLGSVNYDELRELDIDSLRFIIPGEDVRIGAVSCDSAPSELGLQVSRNCSMVGAVACEREIEVSARGLRVNSGSDFPMTFCSFSTLSWDGDVARDTVRLRKECCMLNISFFDARDYTLELSGNYCGTGIDGKALDGEFHVSKSTDRYGNCSIGLPRQGRGGRLLLKVSCSGKTSSSFRLTEFMERAGYDWEEDNLRDFAMSVDYSENVISFYASAWPKSYVMDMDI